jgi:hypothetical protein
MVLKLVTDLIHRPGERPIILLQGDHGTAMAGIFEAQSPQDVSSTQARERFGAFGAYYFPGTGAIAPGDSLSLVNLIPRVINRYFGAGVATSPDSFFVSLLARPLDFHAVDPERLGSAGASPPVGLSASLAGESRDGGRPAHGALMGGIVRDDRSDSAGD